MFVRRMSALFFRHETYPYLFPYFLSAAYDWLQIRYCAYHNLLNRNHRAHLFLPNGRLRLESKVILSGNNKYFPVLSHANNCIEGLGIAEEELVMLCLSY